MCDLIGLMVMGLIFCERQNIPDKDEQIGIFANRHRLNIPQYG